MKQTKRRGGLHPMNAVYAVLLCAFFFVLACWFVPECDEYYFQYWTFNSLRDFIHTNPKDTGVLLVGIPANGRYLGNALGILQAKLYSMPSGVYLRAALFAACSAGLLALLYRYFCSAGTPVQPPEGKESHNRRYWGGGLALCALLLVGAPYGIYSQVLAWGAGFANYVPPVAGMLVLWLMMDRRGGQALPALFLIAFGSQLFAEPVTVYFLFFGATLVLDGVIWYRKTGEIPEKRAAVRRRLISSLWMFFGFVAGAALMFSDSGYRQVGGDGRAVTGENMVRNLAIIASEVVVNHPILTPLLSLFLVAAAFCSIRSAASHRSVASRTGAKGSDRFLLRAMVWLLWIVLTALLIPLHKFLFESNALVITDQLFAYENINIAVGAAVAVIWIGLLALWSAGTWQEMPSDGEETANGIDGCRFSYLHSVRGRLWFWVGSLVIANGPLLILYPIKSRHFFLSYIILCLVALELYGWLARRGVPADHPAIVWLMRAATVACCVGLLFVYHENDRVHQERMDYAEAQIAQGAEEVTLPLLPYRAFVTNEGTSKGDISYVCYREEPWDVKFRFVLWKDWEGYENESND